MTQYEQVLSALKKIGGHGTLDEIYNAIDNIDSWGAKNKKASIASYLSRGLEITKHNETWIYIFAKEITKIDIYCSDSMIYPAIAKKSDNKWKIFGISMILGFGRAEYEKFLFNTEFDDLIPFNSMSGVSYVAVKKGILWGLIRLRQNPEFSAYKEYYKIIIESEAIDINAMDELGREIKMIEDIKYSDVEYLKKKYKVENPNDIRDYIINNTAYYYRNVDKTIIEKSGKDYEVFLNFGFGLTIEGTIRMKKNESTYGFIFVWDAIRDRYKIYDNDGVILDEYEKVSDMFDDNWVMDL